MIARIDHVSIAVPDFDKAKNFFEALGAIPGAGAKDDATKFFWQIFSLGDMSRIELITPTDKGSFLDGFIQSRGSGVHHITLQTYDIKTAIAKLEQLKIPYFGYNEYPGGVWKEIFIHPKYAFGVLIQIAEFNADDWLSPEVKMPDGQFAITVNDGKVLLTLPHPGGGTATIQLTKEQAKKLAHNLLNSINEK
ncbi:MAG TPA: VOC family protein [Spirochaetota bacterium]|nr:VOC family protein [Spirochaetota bacterium]